MRKVLIVELKKGAFILQQSEIDQGLRYAREIRRKAGLSSTADIVVYVLGAQRGVELEDPDLRSGNITVRPVLFHNVLEMAHARTFRLLQRIRDTVGIEEPAKDKIVEDIVGEPVLIESCEATESGG